MRMGEAGGLNAVQTEITVSRGSYKGQTGFMASLLQLSTSFRRPVDSQEQQPLHDRLAPLLQELRAIADQHKNSPDNLLLLLRELEGLHRDVQEGPFRQSLPENRQKLFSLLQTMEMRAVGPTSQGFSCEPSSTCWDRTRWEWLPDRQESIQQLMGQLQFPSHW